MISSKK